MYLSQLYKVNGIIRAPSITEKLVVTGFFDSTGGVQGGLNIAAVSLNTTTAVYTIVTAGNLFKPGISQQELNIQVTPIPEQIAKETSIIIAEVDIYGSGATITPSGAAQIIVRTKQIRQAQDVLGNTYLEFLRKRTGFFLSIFTNAQTAY
jgi:hypothetical protein